MVEPSGVSYVSLLYLIEISRLLIIAGATNNFFEVPRDYFCTDLFVLLFVLEVLRCCNWEGQTGCKNVS